MVQLLKSQDRDTNNPGAQLAMGPEDILLLISRDPEQTRRRLEAVRAQREAEARRKIAVETSRLLRATNARFRNAERTKDPAEAARLRGEAEERLKHIARVNPDAWPWAAQAVVVRERSVVVPEGGGPLYEGLRVGVPAAWDPSHLDRVEFGRVQRDGRIAVRAAGAHSWQLAESWDPRFATFRPEFYDAAWPADEDKQTASAVVLLAEQRLRYTGDWPALGWSYAPDAWVERLWPQVSRPILGALGRVSPWEAKKQRIPAMGPEGLRLTNAPALQAMPGYTALPPTEAGWRVFLAEAPASGEKFTPLAETGTWWWGRAIPRSLLSAEESGDIGDEEAA